MLTQVEQHFFQFMSSVHIVPKSRALDIYNKICMETNPAEPVDGNKLDNELLPALNKFIKTFNLEIQECRDEITYEQLLVLISNAEASFGLKAKFYDKHTTDLFGKILQACVLSKYGHVSEIDVLNLNDKLNMSKVTAQAVLSKLIKDKWLVSKCGRINLTMRSVVEMEPALRNLYADDMKHCPLCRKFLVMGLNCNECEVRVHKGCLEKFHDRIRDPAKHICPECRATWVEEKDVEEEEEMDAEELGPSHRKRTKRNDVM